MDNKQFNITENPLLFQISDLVSVRLSDTLKKFSKLNWQTFEIIVSHGISEESEAKKIVVELLIEQYGKCVSEDTVWRSIKFLINVDALRVQKINTGYRIFNVLMLTEVGRMLYMKCTKKNPPRFEHEQIIKDHANLTHGYMIKDVKNILESKYHFSSVSMNRRENTIRLENGMICISDIIASSGLKRYFFEVECGNHNQHDFNEKFNKLKMLTNDIFIVGQNRDRVTRILKPQIEDWIRAVGKEYLKLRNTTVRLTSISDLNAGNMTYIFDPHTDEPICCFDKKKKEVNRHA